MDIMFIQETIDSLRTLTQLNGALTQLNSLLINETVKESALNSAKEEILTAVENATPKVDLSGVAIQGENLEATNSAILDAITNRFVIYNEETGCLTIENVNIKIE